jgi:hypothetical protein
VVFLDGSQKKASTKDNLDQEIDIEPATSKTTQEEGALNDVSWPQETDEQLT